MSNTGRESQESIIHRGQAAPAAYDSADDDELVWAAQGDHSAFAPLYRRYVTRVYRYTYSRVGNQADAEELTSQVFTAALEGLDRYRPRGVFAGWLFAIARRRCADLYRRPVPSPLEDETADTSSPAPIEYVVEHEQLERLQEVLMQLSDHEKELLRLRFAADLSYKEIGQVLGRSESASKMAMTRLLRRMSGLWEVKDGRGPRAR